MSKLIRISLSLQILTIVYFSSMQMLLNDCQKLLGKAGTISPKNPLQALKRLYYVKDLQDRILEIKEDVLKVQAEFQVSYLSCLQCSY